MLNRVRIYFYRFTVIHHKKCVYIVSVVIIYPYILHPGQNHTVSFQIGKCVAKDFYTIAPIRANVMIAHTGKHVSECAP